MTQYEFIQKWCQLGALYSKDDETQFKQELSDLCDDQYEKGYTQGSEEVHNLS